MREKLTLLIPCKNEVQNLRLCIESARAVTDELLVADSGSTDGTQDLALSLGARLIEREYRTSGDFKNWAIPQATHRWVLLLDADERLSPKLLKEVDTVLRDPRHTGYWMRRDNYFFGHRVRHGGHNNDSVLRLFERDDAVYDGPSDHGEVELMSGEGGWLKNPLMHYTIWSWEDQIRKMDRYTWLQAKQWFDEGYRTNYLQLAFRGPIRFLRDYFWKQGFRCGSLGLQLAFANAYYSFLKQARLWEMQHGRDIHDVDVELNEWQQPKHEYVRSAAAEAATQYVA